MTQLRLVEPNLMDVTFICRNMREMDAREIFATRFDDDPDRLAMDIMQRWSVAWVAKGEVMPIAIVGGVEMWPGMWTAGMFATDDFPQIGLGLTRWVKRRMIPTIQELGLRRAEAKSIEGHTVAHRWLEALGARREGVPHHNYGKGGETFHTYVWEF